VRARASGARRASRAGAFAAAAAVGLACGARTELGAGTSGADASIDVEAADVSAADAPLDSPLVFYGGPFPNPDAAADDADAGDADAGPIALYGAPPPKN